MSTLGPIARWKLHYDDGTTFSDRDGSPSEAPVLGVQVIAQAAGSDIGRLIVQRRDYYWYDDGEWFGGDLFGLFDYLSRSQGRSIVKFGRAVSQEVFQRCLDAAIADPELPKKVAWHPNEIR